MKIQKITHFLFFLFIIFFLSFLPKISQAATTDCVQMGNGGQAPCIQSINYWNGDWTAPKFPTYDEYRNYVVPIACASWLAIGGCGEKTVNGIIDGRTCDGSAYCNEVSSKNPNNKSGVTTIYYYTNAQPNIYHINHSNMQNIFICPNGYGIVVPDSNYGFALCKPSNTTPAVDLSSPNPRCDACQSKSSSSNQQLQGSTTTGDPVSIGSGNKYIIENDYLYQSYSSLGFTRVYNSKSGKWSYNWNYSLSYLETTTLGKTVTISLPNGMSLTYVLNTSSNTWDKLNPIDSNKLSYNGSNQFIYTLDDNSQITFQLQNGSSLANDNNWLATNMKTLGGFNYSFSYDSNKLLHKVSSAGHDLIINQSTTQAGCNNNPVVTSIQGPNNTTTNYTYTSCLLTKVTYPDNNFKTYEYSSGQLTVVRDELGNIIQQTHYITSTNRPGYLVDQDSSNNGTINKITSTYGATTTKITDAIGSSSIISLINQNGQYKPTGYSTLCTFCEGIQGASINYNSNGYMNSITDYKGNITLLSYDTNRNLLTQIKESTNNSSLQRQTDIVYDLNWNLPITITSPSSINIGGNNNNNIISNIYDALTGSLLQKTVSAPESSINPTMINRTWNYIYNNLGQLIEIDNPTYNVNGDKITYTYNTDGQINSITNALNQTTLLSNFDNYGNPQNILYPNGILLNLTYNLRGIILSITKNNISGTSNYTSTLDRNNAQLVSKLTSTSGAYKNFIYDSAQRLSTIEEYGEDNTYLGKTIFTLNDISKLTKIQILDSVGNEIRLSTKQYNTNSQLFKDLTSLNYATTYTYDANGNISNINDANNKNIIFNYDSLNRLVSQTNPDTGVETYTYNPDDSISSFTDSTNITTNYSYNGFGEIIKINSPDTGTTTNIRNLNGDVISKTNARNITTNYTYDILHRPLTIQSNNVSENITLTYDTCLNGIEKICSIQDVSGLTTYAYNDFGQVANKTYSNGSFIKSVLYNYDLYGRLGKTTYSSGLELNYGYYNDKPVSINYSYNGTIGNIISNGVYDPFDNKIKSYSYGNGSTYANVFNKDGLVTNINSSLTSFNQIYGFDTRLNINSMNGNSTATISYDANSRIIGFNNLTYNYNKNSNRTSTINNGTTTTYNNSLTSNQLNSLSGGIIDNFNYDNTGNQTTTTNKTFNYNDSGALIHYSDNLNNYNYLVNSLSQRVLKTDTNNSVNNKWFIYDENKQLISEYDNSNNVMNEYIYLNGVPIALFNNGILYNIYSDHLGTPRTITDQSNNIVWQWSNNEPFGVNIPSISTLEFNLRFPGQYFDKESNLHYNYFRTYNPTIGKYIQSDPIGLDGGTNTYVYTDGNLLNSTDEFGLLKRDINGKIIFGITSYNQYRNIETITSIKRADGFIYTDKGRKVQASLRIGDNPEGFDYTADCHGWTFANGKLWIDNDNVSAILEDEYKIVPYSGIRDGDAIVYYEKNQIIHSLTAINTSEGLKAYGKGGYTPRPYLQDINQGWINPNVSVTFRIYRRIQ